MNKKTKASFFIFFIFLRITLLIIYNLGCNSDVKSDRPRNSTTGESHSLRNKLGLIIIVGRSKTSNHISVCRKKSPAMRAAKIRKLLKISIGPNKG
jgi:hypothetical protein